MYLIVHKINARNVKCNAVLSLKDWHCQKAETRGRYHKAEISKSVTTPILL